MTEQQNVRVKVNKDDLERAYQQYSELYDLRYGINYMTLNVSDIKRKIFEVGMQVLDQEYHNHQPELVRVHNFKHKIVGDEE